MKKTHIKTNDVILQTITKVVFFIIIIFSIYLFFAGHYTPGGGFVGGLMTSSAIVLLLLAYDVKTVINILPVNYINLAAAGLLIAVLTGVGSFFFGVPFLSHTFGHVDLPILGDTELATAVLFDLGVYLVVIGVTLTIIQTIGETE
ncbi:MULTISPECIES: Na(+)/H(+) antiporter subunit B [Metabacillus]|jgi:multicomponent Na+:H+ antiporter subunit B|uniref:Na(+)/H(+) antiporter subunit B n=2 Tax=Metabacillus TaxID=2675233 RepID=A0A6I2M8W0_9BACI|nr:MULTISPECIES: Na(+)/H(+) antiporter subunit B [Metabacillus]OHR68970.1 cation:proton antiporter [Bacillus sp. HMSC76G11]UOK57514.1 Na(+)/H(+) antiporter subunit B [Bacillus sp. OVS6]USK27946.1 Na(+)/H(+) antiporter subunit B [Bacillus sp. CMF21]MRX54765.1 Na(+)/H(+) antiporter subunit B [Metabacillus idriensis]UAL51640.1 Na(+)/H(+) antiporter subunit B [Metabacillus dongyingensis]